MTIRIEIIAERSATAREDAADDEAEVLQRVARLCGALVEHGYEVASATVHGGLTYPGGVAVLDQSPGSADHSAPAADPGGSPDAWSYQ